MPTEKSRRRRAWAKRFREQTCPQKGPDTVDRLAFKYMEMCKIDSSSDSETDASPRWSDNSSKSLQLSTTYKRAARPRKAFGRHYTQSLDPYDGSSEDAASSADILKLQKRRGFQAKVRGGRITTNVQSLIQEVSKAGPSDGTALFYYSDIQMRSLSDSELNMRDSSHHGVRGCTNVELCKTKNQDFKPHPNLFTTAAPLKHSDVFFENTSTCVHSKRKFFLLLGDPEERVNKKKPCVCQMTNDGILSSRTEDLGLEQ